MTGIVVRALAAALMCLIATFTGGAGTAAAGGPARSGAAASPPRPAWQVLVPAGGAVHLLHPQGLAIDRRGTSVRKWMYVVDSGHNRVVKFGTGGRYLTAWGREGSAPGQFQSPTGIAVDKQGYVYVADTGNNRIEKFTPQGKFVLQWGTQGTGPGQFDAPTGIAVGGAGSLFVADRNNGRIEKFSPAGKLMAVRPVFLPPQINPTSPTRPGPYALTVDASGHVIVAVDTGQCPSHCVMDYILLETLSPSGKVIRALAGSSPYGQFSYQPVLGIMGTGTWWQIGALAAGAQGTLYLTTWNPAVTKLSPAAKTVGQWALPRETGGAAPPEQGLALDQRGLLYVADTYGNRVLKLSFGS